MASTNKTDNLNLNQWILTDHFLMEDMNEDNRKLDTAIAANPFTKIMDITTSANAQVVELDVSGIDFTKFSMIQIFINVKATPVDTAQYIYAKINNTDVYRKSTEYANVTNQDNIGYTFTNSLANVSSIMKLEFFGFPDVITSPYPIHMRSSGSSYSSNHFIHEFFAMKIMPANTKLDTISFATESSSVSLAVGARFEIYGVRK